jgi:hypothetical protein
MRRHETLLLTKNWSKTVISLGSFGSNLFAKTPQCQTADISPVFFEIIESVYAWLRWAVICQYLPGNCRV